MLVRDLIRELGNLPPDMEVVIVKDPVGKGTKPYLSPIREVRTLRRNILTWGIRDPYFEHPMTQKVFAIGCYELFMDQVGERDPQPVKNEEVHLKVVKTG